MSAAAIACVAAAFALGAVPFSQILARLRGVDLRAIGSGNTGATNLARALGYGMGAIGLALDALKGAAAVLIPGLVLGARATPALEALAGVASALGHTFSPFLRFKGGKGVATGAGAFAVLAPGATLIALIVFAIVVALTRIVGLASVLAALTLPIAAHLLGSARPIAGAAAVVAVLVVARHRANLARLLRGTESRLGAGGRP